MEMSKNKDNGVHVIDTTEQAPKVDVKAALEALSTEERAELLQSLGFTQRKAREKKDQGPDPRELFQAAREKLYKQMPEIKGIVEGCEFPSSFAVTVGVDPQGLFFANLKRVRNKYGPRVHDDD